VSLRIADIDLVLIGLLLLALTCTAEADSFFPESPLVVKSPNEKYWGKTTIPNYESTTNSYRFLVYSGPMSQSNLVRTVELVNSQSPAAAFLSNDGQSIATFDDWYSRGIGSNTLVIYRGDRMIRRYSLEGITSLSEGELAGHVRRSITSRWWNEVSAASFVEDMEGQYFCIWLDWYSDWLVFDVPTGDKVELSDRLLALCEERMQAFLRHEMPDDEYVMMAGGSRRESVTHPELLRESYLSGSRNSERGSPLKPIIP
jgi:hypothetical protein